MVTDFSSANYLTGQLLIAMPAMGDPRFSKSVIYMCVHNEEGAMGLIVNKPADELSFAELLTQLDIESLGVAPQLPIHFGGPVETGRGFVLHSAEYNQEGTIELAEGMALTATIDILQDIAENRGPRSFCWPLAMPAGEPDNSTAKSDKTHGCTSRTTPTSPLEQITTRNGSSPSQRLASI